MKKNTFLKELQRIEGKTIGSYKNEYGEEFLIYVLPHLDIFFVTGDELDWDFNWQMAGNSIVQVFLANPEEIKGINKILKKYITKPLYEQS